MSPLLEPIKIHRGTTSWTRLPMVIPGVGSVPDFVKDLEAVEDEASGWDGLATHHCWNH